MRIKLTLGRNLQLITYVGNLIYKRNGTLYQYLRIQDKWTI